MKTLLHFEQRTLEPDGFKRLSFKLKLALHCSQETIMIHPTG